MEKFHCNYWVQGVYRYATTTHFLKVNLYVYLGLTPRFNVLYCTIIDLDGNDEVEVEHVMRQMPRYTNIRRRYHAMNMLNRMHADELSSQLNRIKNLLPLAIYMYVEEDIHEEILLAILMLYQTVNDIEFFTPGPYFMSLQELQICF